MREYLEGISAILSLVAGASPEASCQFSVRSYGDVGIVGVLEQEVSSLFQEAQNGILTIRGRKHGNWSNERDAHRGQGAHQGVRNQEGLGSGDAGGENRFLRGPALRVGKCIILL